MVKSRHKRITSRHSAATQPKLILNASEVAEKLGIQSGTLRYHMRLGHIVADYTTTKGRQFFLAASLPRIRRMVAGL